MSAKLGDFGVSRDFRSDEKAAGVETNLGTPYYFSPERLLNRPYNESADMWAVGIILYHMLSKAMPFEKMIPKHIIKSEPNPLPSYVPEEVKKLMLSLLEKDPKKRFSCDRTIKDLAPLRYSKFYQEEEKIAES